MRLTNDLTLRAVLATTVAMAGCAKSADPPVVPKHEAPRVVSVADQSLGKGGPIRFRAQELPFRYDRGETGSAWPVEVTGGGVALADFDGDGDLDLFFVQGGSPRAEDATASRQPTDVLLRNDGAGRFTHASENWGLKRRGYGQGVTVADYDADGDPDVYVTRYGTNTLWRNEGDHFTDVTAEAGVGVGSWSLGAAFFDYDGDGDLDLFVANYFGFDTAAAPFARSADGKAIYGQPDHFDGLPDVLFRNDGGRFTDVTAQAGVAGLGRGMGVIAADFDGDRRVDLLVANDAQANALWRNRGDGTFEDIAPLIGIDLNGQGLPEANMGIARGDTDDDGMPDVIISHYSGEQHTLWRARSSPGGGIFHQDESRPAGLAGDSRMLTGWGIALSDFDLDGRLDLVVTNGQIRREPGQRYEYLQPPILWRGLSGGRFENVSAGAGPYFRELHMGRGLASGDLDDDGDLDLVVTDHHAPAVVLWNESPRAGRWLTLDLRGAAPNTDAVGAEILIEAGGRKLIRSIVGGDGYLSSHDRRVHFGLGPVDHVDRVTVRWPDGREETREGLAAEQRVRWVQPAAPPPP